jgi:hypothetical protein
MDFCPSFNKSLLGSRQAATDALDRIKGEYRFRILISGMKVGPMMRCINLHKHPYDDSEKARQLWHAATLHRRRPVCLANACVSAAAAHHRTGRRRLQTLVSQLV